MITFILNNETVNSPLPPGTLLLDYIRYHASLTGTKIGCREGDCGACTVLVGRMKEGRLVYESVTSCLTALGNISHTHVVTIEGLNKAEGMNPVQQAMADESATQCGFCTPGFVVSMTGFCLNDTPATYEQGLAAVDGNICRCTGYKSIERALQRLTLLLQQRNGADNLHFLCTQKILPVYFKDITRRLLALSAAGNGATGSEQAAFFVGGGTDLYVQQPEHMVERSIDFLLNKPALKGIVREGNDCVIGASATVSDLLASPIFTAAVPGFKQFAKLVSSTPIRNIATLAGNFSNASPIGDLSILFLVVSARLQLRQGETVREIPLQRFFTSYKKTALASGEHIEAIRFAIPQTNYLINLEKVSKRRYLDIASVNTAIMLEMDGDTIVQARLAAGGVAPVPAYLPATSALMRGRKADEQLATDIALAVQDEVTPISDVRGSAAYKRQLLGQLIKAHFICLFPGLNVQTIMGPPVVQGP